MVLAIVQGDVGRSTVGQRRLVSQGKKNTSGDYSTVFVSPAGICGGPMKLQQPCDIAERYVTCTQQGQR